MQQADLEDIRYELQMAQARFELAMQSALTQLYKLERLIAAEQVKPILPPAPVPIPRPPKPIVEPLIINDEWQQVLDLLHKGKDHVLIIGGAGTGKSTLLNLFVENYEGCAVITAFMGAAALRVRGETLHRFFGFGAHALEKDDIQELSDSRQQKYKAIDILIIDEISAVRADLMDAIDRFMRVNGRSKTQPFGGCRVVMFGDLFQLPPVSKEKDEKKWLTDRYGTDTPYFFHAAVWMNTTFKTCQLSTIFRQTDTDFTDALNAIRNGTATSDHLKLINSQVRTTFTPPTGELWLTLTTTIANADQINQKMLNALTSQSKFFDADITGEFDLKNSPTDEHLELKVGASVMFVRNHPDRLWQNGSMGKVTKIEPLTVEIDGIEHEVEQSVWEAITYEFDEKTKKLKRSVKGKFTQIPLPIF